MHSLRQQQLARWSEGGRLEVPWDLARARCQDKTPVSRTRPNHSLCSVGPRPDLYVSLRTWRALIQVMDSPHQFHFFNNRRIQLLEDIVLEQKPSDVHYSLSHSWLGALNITSLHHLVLLGEKPEESGGRLETGPRNRTPRSPTKSRPEAPPLFSCTTR